jgi:hypothetical protein
MNIVEKLMSIYPELTIDDMVGDAKTIYLQNDSDGRGDYIAKWEHPTLPRPTDEQLAGVSE